MCIRRIRILTCVIHDVLYSAGLAGTMREAVVHRLPETLLTQCANVLFLAAGADVDGELVGGLGGGSSKGCACYIVEGMGGVILF